MNFSNIFKGHCWKRKCQKVSPLIIGQGPQTWGYHCIKYIINFYHLIGKLYQEIWQGYWYAFHEPCSCYEIGWGYQRASNLRSYFVCYSGVLILFINLVWLLKWASKHQLQEIFRVLLPTDFLCHTLMKLFTHCMKESEPNKTSIRQWS